MLSTSHIWEQDGQARSIFQTDNMGRKSRVTCRTYKCKRCGGRVRRVHVGPDYAPAATAKVEKDDQKFDCEQYAVYHVMTC